MNKETPDKPFNDEANPQSVKYEIHYHLDGLSTASLQLSESKKRKLQGVENLRDNEDSVKSIKRCRKQNEVLNLDCDWSNCDYNTVEYADFIQHVKHHINDAEVRPYSPPHPDVFVCLWQDCAYESPISCDMVRHINYHSFHTKLKSLGLNMIKEQNLKGCQLDTNQRNLFNDLNEPLKCKWSYCCESETDFDHPQTFFWHVSCHMHEESLDCKWGDCTKRDFASKTRLKEHLRSHSQEKLIGCPTCGAMFASRVKLLDHLKRQQENASEFTCTNCNKSFALERLLRDHMRSHINQYECRECGMRWPTPSSLQVHIKYRHTEDRDYPCELCNHRAKSHADLKQHTRTHQEEVLTCMEGCGFQCKSNSIMKNHFLKKHVKEGPTYACHLCNKIYRRGAYLTHHLKKMHQVFSTASRLRYSRDDATGFYRAQLIRLEMELEKEDDPDAELETNECSSVRSGSPSCYNQSSTAQSSPQPQDMYTSSPIEDLNSWHSPRSPVMNANVRTSSPVMYNAGDYVAVVADEEHDAFTSQEYRILGNNTENIEIDITGDEFVSQKNHLPTASNFPQENSQEGTQINSNDDPTKYSDATDSQLSRDRKISEIKRIGAKMSDLNLFLSAIGNMFPDP